MLKKLFKWFFPPHQKEEKVFDFTEYRGNGHDITLRLNQSGEVAEAVIILSDDVEKPEDGDLVIVDLDNIFGDGSGVTTYVISHIEYVSSEISRASLVLKKEDINADKS